MGYPGISQKIQKKVEISFFKQKTKVKSQDIPNPEIPQLKNIRDIPGYPDLRDIPADNSTFWDNSSHPDLTRLILYLSHGYRFL